MGRPSDGAEPEGLVESRLRLGRRAYEMKAGITIAGTFSTRTAHGSSLSPSPMQSVWGETSPGKKSKDKLGGTSAVSASTAGLVLPLADCLLRPALLLGLPFFLSLSLPFRVS